MYIFVDLVSSWSSSDSTTRFIVLKVVLNEFCPWMNLFRLLGSCFLFFSCIIFCCHRHISQLLSFFVLTSSYYHLLQILFAPVFGYQALSCTCCFDIGIFRFLSMALYLDLNRSGSASMTVDVENDLAIGIHLGLSSFFSQCFMVSALQSLIVDGAMMLTLT